MCHVSIFSGYQRVAYIATAGVCIACCLPLDGICLTGGSPEDSSNLVRIMFDQVNVQNPDALVKEFDQFSEVLNISENPFDEGCKFLRSFIKEVNDRYGLNLTLLGACQLVKENLHTLQIPVEVQDVVLATIESLEFNSDLSRLQQQSFQKMIEKKQSVYKVVT